MDVSPGAACAFLGQGRAVVIELQGHADDIVAFFGQLCGNDGAVHAAGHGDDDAGL